MKTVGIILLVIIGIAIVGNIIFYPFYHIFILITCVLYKDEYYAIIPDFRRFSKNLVLRGQVT